MTTPDHRTCTGCGKYVTTPRGPVCPQCLANMWPELTKEPPMTTPQVTRPDIDYIAELLKDADTTAVLYGIVKDRVPQMAAYIRHLEAQLAQADDAGFRRGVEACINWHGEQEVYWNNNGDVTWDASAFHGDAIDNLRDLLPPASGEPGVVE